MFCIDSKQKSLNFENISGVHSPLENQDTID